MESYKKLHKYYTEGKFRPFLEALSREIQQAPADFQFQLLKLQLPSMVEHVLEQVTRLLSADASLDTTLCIFLRCYQRELKEDIVLRCVGTTRFIGALFGLASCRDSTTRLRRYTMHVLTTVIESKAVKKVFMESLVRGDHRGGHGVKQALHQLLVSLLESPGAGMSYDIQESTLEMAVYTYRALIKEERKGEASELVRHLPSALRDTFKRLTIKNFSEQSRHILNAINAKHSHVASFEVEAVSLQPVKPSGTSSSAVRKLGRVDWIDFGAEELQFTIFDDDDETRTLISVPHKSLRGVQLDEPTCLLAFTHGEDDHTWDIGETFKLPAGVYPRFRFILRFDNETFKRLSNVVNKRIKASRMLAVPVRDTASQASRAGSQSERAGVRCSVATMMVMAPPASIAVPGSHPTVVSHKPHRSLTHLLRDESQDGSAPLGLFATKPAASLPHDHTRKPLRSVSHGGGNTKGNTRPSPRPPAPPPDASAPPQPQPAETTTHEHRHHSQQQQHGAPESEEQTLGKEGKPRSQQLHHEAPEATQVEQQQQQQPQQAIEPSTEQKEQLEMELSNRADVKQRRKQMSEPQIEPLRLQAPPPSPADSFSLAQPDEPLEPRELSHDREDGGGEDGHGHEEMMAVDSQHTQTCPVPLSPKLREQALQTTHDAEQQQEQHGAGQKPPRPQQGDEQRMPPPAPRPPSPGLSSLDRMALEEFDAQPPQAPQAQQVLPLPSHPARVDNTRKSRNQRKAESTEVRLAKHRGKSKVPPRATATAQQAQPKAHADKGKRRGRSSTALAASQRGTTDRAAAAPAKAAVDKPKPAPATSASTATAASACGATPVPPRVGHATKAVIERPGPTTMEADVSACSRTTRETPTKPSAPLPFKKSSVPLPSGHSEAAPPQTARPTRVVKASDPKPLRSSASTRNKGQKQEQTEHDAPRTRRGAGRAQHQEKQGAGEEVGRLGPALVAAAGGDAVAAQDEMEEQDGDYLGSPIESSQSAERRHVELFATIQSLIKEENRRRKTLKHQQETAAAVCADYKDKHTMVMQELDKADACIESGLSTLMEIQRFLKRTRAEIEDMGALLGPLENRDNGSSAAPAAKRRKSSKDERDDEPAW